MKKEYNKPEIMFENFTISTCIAAGCDHLTSLLGKDACGYLLRSGDIVFLSKTTGCGSEEPSGTYGEGNNMICYHSPEGEYNVFTS